LTRPPAARDGVGVRAALVTAVLLFAFAGSSTAQDLPLLVGTVGPGFTIDLADANGKHVDELVAGKYTLLVHDLSNIHNFVLGSKRTQERLASTEVEFVGDATFTIDLVPGLYAYACSPHFQTMNGSFQVVGAPSPAPPPTPRPKALPARVTATTVAVGAKRVAAGAYRLTVADRSRTRNFHLVGPGVNRRTGKAFVGTVTWTVRLARGIYRYGNDPKLTGRLVVG
jgi:plastocyanin